MKLFQKLVCMALTATATASLSICAFAADYTFDTAADTDYYPSTSYEDTYGTAYHYGSNNLVDDQRSHSVRYAAHHQRPHRQGHPHRERGKVQRAGQSHWQRSERNHYKQNDFQCPDAKRL